MFQESLFVAVKLLVIACVVALVAAMLLTRVACARIVAMSDVPDHSGRGPRPARKGSHPMQEGV